jgi:hypothetical protein
MVNSDNGVKGIAFGPVYGSSEPQQGLGFDTTTGAPYIKDTANVTQLTINTTGIVFGASTFTSITASAATFPIKGLDATTGNTAGGTLSLTGGAGFGTGAGAAITQTGGASGAGATGNGGASTNVGGAALSTNGTGGAVGGTGGAGSGNGSGGAVLYTSGAGGTTGPAGAITLTVGAATAANGASITLNAGNGAGGTNGGGNINLVPGTAVSTGIPGEIQVNSAAGLMSVGWQQFLAASVPVSGTSYPFFVATRAFRVKAVSVYASSTTTPTVDIFKDTGTNAPGAGTSVLTGAISFSAVANTVVNGTVSTTIATVTLAAGDRLSAKWGSTVGALTGAVVNVLLTPV